MGFSSLLTIGLGILLTSGSLLEALQPKSQVVQSRNYQRFNCYGRQVLRASICPGDGIASEEQRLYNLLNQYRAQYGLPPVPLSPSLSIVANRHVLDIDQNIGRLTHSWSNCRYNAADQSTYPCIWKAPQRLGTAYRGNGYENAYSISTRATAVSALRAWKRSQSHNAVMLNKGVWKSRNWQAVGVGIHGKYAVLWFGEEADPVR
ncbi:MAG: CAP domain-containing protein [Microcoleaceae cyanobacterium]